MSYRIYIGIIKKKDLDNHLSKCFSDSDEDYDKKWDFLNSSTDVELYVNTPIEKFKVVDGYNDEEYPPYVLSKKDFQKILDFYKHFLKESFESKQKEIIKILKNEDKDTTKLRSVSIHFHYLTSYFDVLIKQKMNIDSNGLFLLDYFYLVKMYENWKNGDRALITHG